ncbi:MAG TPA: response regulator, partial [Stellaceae bacterium]|nr:response regulator [Stellaceae bacterium]
SRASVLLVEDDQLVAEGTAELLADLGHAVIVAGSGTRALELVQQYPGLDLVITDVTLPGMLGIELARRIRGLRPELPIVLCSGHAELPEADSLGLPRLIKPYRISALGAAVDAALETASAIRSVRHDR